MFDNWYVLQVMAGKEELTKKQILSYIDPLLVIDCFIPQTVMKKKYQGSWHLEYKILFPGYLFLVTDSIEKIYVALKQVPGLTKVLGLQKDEKIYPLPASEAITLMKFANEDHIVDMSLGYIEGDIIHVTQGPLMGQEGLIRRIDRHKRIAEVEVTLFGQIVKAKVGLEIIKKV